MKKYLVVFLVIVLWQLVVVNEIMAQRSRATATRSGGTKVLALSSYDVSSWISYKKFWDGQSQGFLLAFDGDVCYYLNQGSLGLGAFGSAAGGGGNYNDGSYNEPSWLWQAGVESKLRTSTSAYSLRLGYGQIFRDGEIASGLKDEIFGSYLMAQLKYLASGRRLADRAWLPALGICLEGRKALKKETPPWPSNYIINYDLVPEIVKGTAELTVVDIKTGDLLIPWGLSGAASAYDFKKLKVFYEVGSFLDFTYANNSVARIFATYENGVAGISNIKRWTIGISLDGSFLAKINQAAANKTTNNTNTNRRRTR